MENKTKGGKPDQNIGDLQILYKQAEDTLPAYEMAMQGFLDDLRRSHPGQFETAQFKLGPLKELERIAPKLQGEYEGQASRLVDIVRGTFISDNADDLPRIQAALEEKFSVIRVKDNVFRPTETGLRNYHNNIVMPNGHIVETQVMPAQIWSIKARSHDLMEDSQNLKREYPVLDDRPPEIQTKIDRLNKENRVLQNAAVYDTGLNNYLNPELTIKEHAQFTVPFEASKEFNAAVEPTAHMTYGFNRAASPFLKKATFVILGALPVIGLLPNTAEAGELKATLETAIQNGQISNNALIEYDSILLGHIAQGADPTVLMGEAGIQAAFNDWADRYDVQGELRDKLRPSSLALMMKEGTVYIADNIERFPQATYDVTAFTLQQGVEGGVNLGNATLNTFDAIYDNMSGETARRKAIYEALPILNKSANDDLYDHENNQGNGIQMFPSAHALAEIKTQIVSTKEMIEQINHGEKEPFNGMSRDESTEFLQERIDRLNERFEENFEEAQANGTLSDIDDYIAIHGSYSPSQFQQQPSLENLPQASNNDTWDTPRLVGMKR